MSDGPLIVMLFMGVASVAATVFLVDAIYPGQKDALIDGFVKTPILAGVGVDTGIPGDLLLLSFSYVPLMYGAIAMRNAGMGKSIMLLKTPYNALMTLFSLYCFVTMFLWRFGPDFPGLGAENCTAAWAHVNQLGSFKTAATLFFWSKYIEWIDSVFLLMGGKPISVLHGFHHLGAPIAMGSMVAAGSEYVWIFVFWNSFVHTIMYFYYGCSGIGIKLRVIRPWITSMQIVQFCTGLPYLYVTYRTMSSPGGGCANPGTTFAFYYQWIYVGSVLGLFMNFFVQQYVAPKKAKDDKKGK